MKVDRFENWADLQMLLYYYYLIIMVECDFALREKEKKSKGSCLDSPKIS